MSKFTDDMAAMGVVNAWEVSRRYDCPVIFFDTQHHHAFGTRDHRATVQFPRDGKWFRKTIRIRTAAPLGGLKGSREAHVQAAQEWAASRLGVAEWVPTGFHHAWMPKEVHARMKAELAAWRKAH
jgi:hypothetical protein